jgi:hypothetical protein
MANGPQTYASLNEIFRVPVHVTLVIMSKAAFTQGTPTLRMRLGFGPGIRFI